MCCAVLCHAVPRTALKCCIVKAKDRETERERERGKEQSVKEGLYVVSVVMFITLSVSITL